MKKFSKIVYFLILALLILSMAGCNGSTTGSTGSSGSTDNNSGNNNNNNNGGSNNNGGGEQNGGNDNNSGGGTDYEPVDTTNASAAITTENGVTKIVLSTGDSSLAAASGITVQNYVWHVSPDHAGEYWTFGDTSFDSEEDVQTAISAANQMADGVYIARDIRYVPNTLEFSSSTVNKEQSGQDKCYVSYYSTNAESVDIADKYILAALPAENNNSLSTVKAAMTHDPSDAYNYPVLHITQPGTYELSGEWQGQIWVDVGKKKDTAAQAILILNGLTVSCDVAPALVFYGVYQGASYLTSSDVQGHSMDVAATLSDTEYTAGAVVLLANGSVNNFYGTNVARLNNVAINDDYENDANATSYIGQFVKAQDKMYKLDGAFHSRRSMVIALDDDATSGTLNINSKYEGLNSELHMVIDSGTINVYADDDGINVNEDYTSVFHMKGGSLTVDSQGGDGIDSNGYIIFTGADALSITASQLDPQNPTINNLNAQAEGPLDADYDVYMTQDVFNIYKYAGHNSNGGQGPGGEGGGPGGEGGPNGPQGPGGPNF